MMPDIHAFAEQLVLRLFSGRSFLTINEVIILVEGLISAATEADAAKVAACP